MGNKLYKRTVNRFSLKQIRVRIKDLNILRRWRLRRIPKFPLMLQIETSSNCPFNCIFCARNEMKRPKQNMTMEMFRKIIDESVKYGRRRSIYLYKDGDPLKNPYIAEMIKYCKDNDASETLALATSGLLLTEDMAKKILDSGLDEIWFSLDGFSKVVHNKVKGIDCHDQVYDNVVNFIEQRNKRGLKHPYVRAKFLTLDVNVHEIDDFKKYWNRYADEVVIVEELSSWDGSNERVNKVVKEMGIYRKIWQAAAQRYPCDRLWYMACITSNGNVTPCVEDWDERCVIGNINENSLYQIWHGELLHDVRKKHIEGKFDEVQLCAKCEFWKRRNMGEWYLNNKEKALKRFSELEK